MNTQKDMPMTTAQTVKVEFDDQVVERRWSDASEKMDWTPFPVGYGILLNERYQFPMDMALVRAKLDTKRQLFVDNHMIAHMQGVVRETHAAKDHPANPVFAPYFNFPNFICPDPEHGYRLYYGSAGGLLNVAYSTDGIDWQMPDLNVFDLSSIDSERFIGGANNVVASGELHGLLFEPDDPNPDRRWKGIFEPHQGVIAGGRSVRHPAFPYQATRPQRDTSGGTPFVLCTSPDGYRWTFEAETNHRKGPFSDVVAPDHWPLGGGDVFKVRWDPKLGKYIGTTKHRIGPDHRMSPIFHAARVVGQIESDDLVHWSAPRIIAYPDGEDAKQPKRSMHGIYEADGYPYESMWLNNFSMSNYTPVDKKQMIERKLVANRPYLKRNWIRLAASRDGRHWYYFGDRKPFIALGDNDSWKPHYLRAVNLVTTCGPIVKDDELWYYYRGGRTKGEGPRACAMGLAILRRDGFASLNADEDGGLVITRPFIFEGNGDLFVNADVAHDGELRIAVVDEDTAEELDHFGRDDSVAITDDAPRTVVRWRQRDSLAELRDRYVRLAFHLRNAKLYSFWID